jgi:type III pantothenate kinase
VARRHREHAHGRRIRGLAVAAAVDAGLGFRAIDACIISSVVPQSIFNLRNLSRRYFNVEPLVIGENAKLGVDVRIDKPSEAGADRLVNAVGAHMIYPGR